MGPVGSVSCAAARSKTVEELNGVLSSVKKGQSVLQEQLDKYKKLAEGMPAVRAENKLLRRALLRKVSLPLVALFWKILF